MPFELERQLLDRLLERAIQAAQPAEVVPPALPPAPDTGRILVVGAGKAAAAMALAAEAHYGDLGFDAQLYGAVATRHGYGLRTRLLQVMEAGHPVPDADSEKAALQALQLAGNAGPSDLIVVLLSGGASAIWSAPATGLTLANKQATTRALLKSGARIHDVNCVRKHLSRIKGGRLARSAGGAQIVTLAISDVPGDDPAVIGSGPTVADPSTLEEARGIVATLGQGVPASVRAALADSANETVKPGDPALARTRYTIVAAPRLSLAAARAAAETLGYEVVLLGDALEGEARDVAAQHARLALEMRASSGRPLALLSGGELTVTVRGNGRGGPNQEYALALAIALQGAPGISAIAADTDGADGGSGAVDDPAGAIVLPDTLVRARARSLDARAHLADNDSTGFFASLGDLVVKGPTQTNVNDFRAILIQPSP